MMKTKHLKARKDHIHAKFCSPVEKRNTEFHENQSEQGRMQMQNYVLSAQVTQKRIAEDKKNKDEVFAEILKLR